MATVASLINTLSFVCLAALHFYWAFGGRRGLAVAIPVEAGAGKPLFSPGPVITLVVAAGLLLFALLSLGAAPFWQWDFGNRVMYGNIFIAIIFSMRAVGDFRYVGFFKKVVHTPFARNDSRYYSPLCIIISVMALLLALQHI